MDKSISIEMINKFQQTCDTDEKLKISRNAATHNEVTDLAMDWNKFRKIDFIIHAVAYSDQSKV